MVVGLRRHRAGVERPSRHLTRAESGEDVVVELDHVADVIEYQDAVDFGDVERGAEAELVAFAATAQRIYGAIAIEDVVARCCW